MRGGGATLPGLRTALSGACLLLLTGCGSGGGDDYKQFLSIVRQGFAQYKSNGAITRDQAAAIPYASMGYRLNGGREAILVLATDTADDLLWTSSNHVVMVTRNGRLKRSLGLGHDLGGQTAENIDDIPPPFAALKGTVQYRRSEDFPDLGLYAVTLNCRLAPLGPQTISILQQNISTIRVSEHCTATNPAWSFTDVFWIDSQSGFAWRTEQHIHPKGDVLETEIFRPPG